MLHEIVNLDFPSDINYERSLFYYEAIQTFRRYGETLNDVEVQIVQDFKQCRWDIYSDIAWLLIEKSYSKRLVKKVEHESFCPEIEKLIQILKSQSSQ